MEIETLQGTPVQKGGCAYGKEKTKKKSATECKAVKNETSKNKQIESKSKVQGYDISNVVFR